MKIARYWEKQTTQGTAPNGRDLVFMDVDFPNRRASIPLPGFLRKLFGQSEQPNVEETVLENIREAAKQHPQYGYRIYRTNNSYRVMVHTDPIPSQSPQAAELLEAFDADPLYRRLCEHQECYRARLTPKPWRCRLPNPPCRYPFSGADQKTEYEKWETKYRSGIDRFSTFRYVETVGPMECNDQLQGLIELHDSLTKAMSNDPLA